MLTLDGICWKCGEKYQLTTVPSKYCPKCSVNVIIIYTNTSNPTILRGGTGYVSK